MKAIANYVQTKCHFSNYQMAQLNYLFKSLFSDVSKLLIMGLFFHRHLALYFFALCIMIWLRCTTGGLHFYTYWGCFVMSFCYFLLSIYILPNISLPVYLQILLLLAGTIICYRTGLITSKYRPEQPEHKKQICRTVTCTFILLYLVLICIMPENKYIAVGFWVIILHSLQLLAAKYRNGKEAD